MQEPLVMLARKQRRKQLDNLSALWVTQTLLNDKQWGSSLLPALYPTLNGNLTRAEANATQHRLYCHHVLLHFMPENLAVLKSISSHDILKQRSSVMKENRHTHVNNKPDFQRQETLFKQVCSKIYLQNNSYRLTQVLQAGRYCEGRKNGFVFSGSTQTVFFWLLVNTLWRADETGSTSPSVFLVSFFYYKSLHALQVCLGSSLQWEMMRV